MSELITDSSPTSGLAADSTLVRRPTAEQWSKCINALLRLRNLDDDWDGEGSPAPSTANVDRAIEWVQQLRQASPDARLPQPVPGTDGEVVLVWHQGPYYLQAEICKPYRFEWMLTCPGRPAEQWVSGGEILASTGRSRW